MGKSTSVPLSKLQKISVPWRSLLDYFASITATVNIGVVGDLIGQYDKVNSPTLIQRKARPLVLRLIHATTL
jgi:hypothetical protein